MTDPTDCPNARDHDFRTCCGDRAKCYAAKMLALRRRQDPRWAAAEDAREAEGKRLSDALEAFRARVEEAIFVEMYDPRNHAESSDFRRGLISGRIILNREATNDL